MGDMGSRIRQKRLEMGLSGEELGKRLGVQRAAVNKWESGEVENIKRNTIAKMADIFGCSPAWLMGWEDAEQNKVDYTFTINGNDYRVETPREMSEDMRKRMLAYFDKLLALSEKDQTMVMSILDAVIKKED